MKPFNLEKALKGYSVCKMDGTKVSGVTLLNRGTYPVIACINDIPYGYTMEGYFYKSRRTNINNLRMSDKQDLKDFLIPGNVVVRGDIIYLIQGVKGINYFVRKGGLDPIRLDFEREFNEFSIKAIYHIPNPYIFGCFLETWKIDNLELLWERNKVTELTMKEIADKFNIPVEQIRIKK